MGRISGAVRPRDTVPPEQTVIHQAGTRPVAVLAAAGSLGRARGDPLLEGVQLLGAPLGSMILPPAFVHSSAPLMLTNPLPLQAFLPLHEFCALAQAPWPLHALTPPQCTSPPALSAAGATTAPLSRRLAAALAISMPFRHPFIVPPSNSLSLKHPPSRFDRDRIVRRSGRSDAAAAAPTIGQPQGAEWVQRPSSSPNSSRLATSCSPAPLGVKVLPGGRLASACVCGPQPSPAMWMKTP